MILSQARAGDVLYMPSHWPATFEVLCLASTGIKFLLVNPEADPASELRHMLTVVWEAPHWMGMTSLSEAALVTKCCDMCWQPGSHDFKCPAVRDREEEDNEGNLQVCGSRGREAAHVHALGQAARGCRSRG